MAGVKTMPVHYRGGGDAMKDLLSGQVKMMFSSIAPVIGSVQEGKLIGIATTGAKRDPAFPNLPTVAEAGLPGFETRLWIGITVRAGTPKPIIDKLAAAATKAAQDPTVVATLAKQGFAAARDESRAVRRLLSGRTRQVGQGHQGYRNGQELGRNRKGWARMCTDN